MRRLTSGRLHKMSYVVCSATRVDYKHQPNIVQCTLLTKSDVWWEVRCSI